MNNASTLEKQEAQQVDVTPQLAVIPSKIGSDEFNLNLIKEFAGPHAWRSAAKLAEKLGVDVKELESFLDKNKDIIKQSNDGSVLYALKNRVAIADKTNKQNKTTVKTHRQQLNLKEQYALSSINMLSVMMEQVLEKYGQSIFTQSEESLSLLTKSLKQLQSGTALLATAIKANTNHLI